MPPASDTTSAHHRLPLPESFRSGSYRVPDPELIGRMVYLPAIDTLVTLAAGNRDLLIRKLPPLGGSTR